MQDQAGMQAVALLQLHGVDVPNMPFKALLLATHYFDLDLEEEDEWKDCMPASSIERNLNGEVDAGHSTLRETYMESLMQGKVAAMHAHVPELEARLAQLQAEVAPLVERHQVLSDQLPWKQQLVHTHSHTVLCRTLPIAVMNDFYLSPAIF